MKLIFEKEIDGFDNESTIAELFKDADRVVKNGTRITLTKFIEVGGKRKKMQFDIVQIGQMII